MDRTCLQARSSSGIRPGGLFCRNSVSPISFSSRLRNLVCSCALYTDEPIRIDTLSIVPRSPSHKTPSLLLSCQIHYVATHIQVFHSFVLPFLVKFDLLQDFRCHVGLLRKCTHSAIPLRITVMAIGLFTVSTHTIRTHVPSIVMMMQNDTTAQPHDGTTIPLFALLNSVCPTTERTSFRWEVTEHLPNSQQADRHCSIRRQTSSAERLGTELAVL